MAVFWPHFLCVLAKCPIGNCASASEAVKHRPVIWIVGRLDNIWQGGNGRPASHKKCQFQKINSFDYFPKAFGRI